MSNVVRFTLSTARDLFVHGVGMFRAGVLDIDANKVDSVARARYLVRPYHAVEVGIVPAGTAAPTLPAVPAAPAPDPYPQYVTDADLANPSSGPSVALRAAYGLSVAATASANATLAANKHTPVDATSGARTMTLPTGKSEGTRIIVEKLDASTNTVTVSGSIRGSASTVSLVGQYETLSFLADSAGSWHPGPGHKTKAYLDATYTRAPLTVASILANRATTPITGPHRCGGNVFPENTFEAIRGSIALGNSATILDLDVVQLSDGALGIMHDDTIDRTTTGTGSASNMTTPQWMQLNIDAGTWLAPGWSNTLRAPLLEEVLDQYGGKHILEVEAKSTAAVPAVAAAINRRGLGKSVMIISDRVVDIPTIKALGVESMFSFGTIASTTDLTLRAQVIAAGPTMMAIPLGTATADMAALINTGIPVVAGALRHSQADALRALGVAAVGSDEPAYTFRRHGRRITDSWASKTFGHGFLSSVAQRATFVDTPHGAGIEFGTVSSQWFHLIGEVSPTASTNITIDVFVTMPTLPADLTRLFQIAVYDTDAQPGPGLIQSNGYAANFRADGQIFAFRLNQSTNNSTAIGSKTNAPVSAPAAGAVRQLRLQITSTGVTATDVTTGATATIADTTYRPAGGWYVSLGKSDNTGGVGRWQADTLSIT